MLVIKTAADHHAEYIFTLGKQIRDIIAHTINAEASLVVERVNERHIGTVVIVGIGRDKLVRTDSLSVDIGDKIAQSANRQRGFFALLRREYRTKQRRIRLLFGGEPPCIPEYLFVRHA